MFFILQRNADIVIKMLVVSMDIVSVRTNTSEMVSNVGVSFFQSNNHFLNDSRLLEDDFKMMQARKLQNY